jgi:hypothetical protein
MPSPSLEQLRRALQISEQIESLKTDLASFFGGVVDVAAEVLAAPMAKAEKRTLSPAAKAKIAAGQKKRLARPKKNEEPVIVVGLLPATAKDTPKPRKKKGRLSAAGRARIAAAQKARWAAAKVKTSPPASPKAAPKKKRYLSPEARARIVAAVKARWQREKKGK